MAAAPLSLGTQFSEELSCSICLELFTRPKVLPCQHTFCQDCLQDHAEVRMPFQCPHCRQQVRLPPQGVTDLPDNHLVRSLCERIQREHSRNRCSFHPSQEVKVYCRKCKVPVCNECFEEDHDSHATTSFKKAAQEIRETGSVQALIAKGRNILKTYNSFMDGLRMAERTENEQKQQADNSITQAYQALMKKVEENHMENSAKIQNARDDILPCIQELSDACDQAEQLLEQGGVEFLTQEAILTKVIELYKGKAAPTPVQTQPVVFQPIDTPVLGNVTSAFTHRSTRVTVGVKGSGKGQFSHPVGVTVSAEGEIFVADSKNQRIQVFTLQGTFLRQFPTVVSKQKMTPYDVARDGEGNLWVVGSTSLTDLAVKFNKNGKRLLRRFNLQQFSQRSRGVAVDTRRNHILITQTTGDRNNPHGEVQVFRPDRTLVRTLGAQQTLWNILFGKEAFLKCPAYITVDREGNIFLTDCGKDCVYVCNEDGQFLFQFGGSGSGEGQLCQPRGICTDKAGNIIVADTGNSRVEMFDKTGKFLRHITRDLKAPMAVAMATQGQLVVTDCLDQTVTIFDNY
ncbi:hypothetical protein Bbelb_247380 [Branchiostoma belcheri]|nr:hypothetical protein Bbelb_247380 [Branchiostoma belcheri]